MIGIMLVGLLLSVAVTFSGTRVEAPTDAMSGTVEVIRAGESRGHIAPAIAEVDRAITTDA